MLTNGCQDFWPRIWYVLINVQNHWKTHAFLTSSIFRGPVGGKPRIVLSEHDPTVYDSSSDSVSLLAFTVLHLYFQLGCSLHSNPDVELWEKESHDELEDQVYHLLPNEAWKNGSECSSKSSAKLSFLNLPGDEKASLKIF